MLNQWISLNENREEKNKSGEILDVVCNQHIFLTLSSMPLFTLMFTFHAIQRCSERTGTVGRAKPLANRSLAVRLHVYSSSSTLNMFGHIEAPEDG